MVADAAKAARTINAVGFCYPAASWRFDAWWDVPVAEISGLDSTRKAREEYERNKRTQQTYLGTHEKVETP